MDVDMDEVKAEDGDEDGDVDTTMTDADDLWQSVTDESANQGKSTAHEG